MASGRSYAYVYSSVPVHSDARYFLLRSSDNILALLSLTFLSLLHSDLMQFKDEMLKNLREMERKIMTKVNKNQTDLSSDLNTITKSLDSLKANNNSIIDSITEQKLNMNKISSFESDLKKLNSALNGQEKKINDSLIEISYIRDRYEKSLSDTLCVPGIIGKNCKYSNFNDYIISNTNEIMKLKTEKESNKKESKDLKQKLEQGIKSLSNLVDNFINRSKLYTDSTKKALIDLIDTKITELDAKNLELLAKVCKIDTELEQKMKAIGDDLNELNTNKSEQIQKVEDKITEVNSRVEVMDKSIKETKEELNSFKNNKENYMNEINEIKNNSNFDAVQKTDNNYEINENNITSNVNDSKEINSILNKDKNIKEIQNSNSNIINNNQQQSNLNHIINQFDIKNNNNINNIPETKNFLLTNNDNNPINNTNTPRINNETNVNEKPIIKFNNNNINNTITTFSNLHKNIKFSNPELVNNFISNNKKISTENFKEEFNTKRNNPVINYNKRKFFNFEKNSISYLKKENPKKIIKEKNTKNINNISFRQKKEKFPMIQVQEKLIKNLILSNEAFLAGKNLSFNKPKNISPNRNKKMNDKMKNKNLKNKFSIDKETGVGCKVVKLSFEDDSITPYNTNGLLTMATNKFLKKRSVKPDESLSFSFDSIFSNIYQHQSNRNNINQNRTRCNKTVQAFFGDDKLKFDKVLSSIDDNIKKEMFKTIKL